MGPSPHPSTSATRTDKPAPSSKPKAASKPKPSFSSLTSIVSNLVRAAAGSSAEAIPDHELDRHVADLLLKEATEKQKAWGERGTKAYYVEDDDECVPLPCQR